MKNEMKLCAAILLFGQMVIDILHLRSFTAKIMEILWSDACINGDHFTNTISLYFEKKGFVVYTRYTYTVS